MYRYSFETLEYVNGFAKNKLHGHQETIERFSNAGWRFVAAIPTKSTGTGLITQIDLVFEQDASSDGNVK